MNITVSKILRKLYILSLLVIAAGCSEADTAAVEPLPDGMMVKEIVSGLGVPWGLAFISDTEMLITERQGEIKRLNIVTGKLTVVSGVPEVFTWGQGGLLDVAVPDAYVEGGWIYFTYAKPVDPGAATTLARARLENTELVDWQELFVSKHQSRQPVHFGSRIVFDGRGHVFFSHGERGERDVAQDIGDHGGSILRLNLDGSIPADNPFVGNKNAMPEIWSYGHRNPQGLAYDSKTDRLWAIEHGPRGGDEINLILPGKNYGWPVISYGMEYAAPVMVGEGTHRDGMEQPIKYYVPSIAPSSLLLYRGEYYPGWDGDLFAGALKLMHLNRVMLDKDGAVVDEKRYLNDMQERIRDVVQGPDGRLYLSTDSGKIVVLVKK